MSQAKEAQIKLYKTREDKELDKVIALENKVKVLNDIVYKTGQSVQTMNMLNRNCKTSFAKPDSVKKAQRESSFWRTCQKCERLETELSKNEKCHRVLNHNQKSCDYLELELQQCKEKIKNDKSFQRKSVTIFLKDVNSTLKFKTGKAKLSRQRKWQYGELKNS
ncbi:hypothetical protein Tco_1371424 [Tanacetum coccineum]